MSNAEPILALLVGLVIAGLGLALGLVLQSWQAGPDAIRRKTRSRAEGLPGKSYVKPKTRSRI